MSQGRSLQDPHRCIIPKKPFAAKDERLSLPWYHLYSVLLHELSGVSSGQNTALKQVTAATGRI
ncbi:hypothetical protein ACVLD2_002559 [Paenibacillus sp. PvR052]|nr:hypothetical protein [Paenibacillus sp. PvP091]MBP1172664.1 hypothetical protein [Paenibacillus sp. PvR098]MBP2439044.1 hypothetical protein [Paenibacillus sp. PvP052]